MLRVCTISVSDFFTFPFYLQHVWMLLVAIVVTSVAWQRLINCRVIINNFRRWLWRFRALKRKAKIRSWNGYRSGFSSACYYYCDVLRVQLGQWRPVNHLKLYLARTYSITWWKTFWRRGRHHSVTSCLCSASSAPRLTAMSGPTSLTLVSWRLWRTPSFQSRASSSSCTDKVFRAGRLSCILPTAWQCNIVCKDGQSPSYFFEFRERFSRKKTHRKCSELINGQF